ncbi:MAG: hypothetical protein IJI22_04220 [Bacilli bacterium]|nr:hypothetical protein [Bacilli bacterium]
MNKSIFIFLFILLFVSSGCSDKNREIEVFNETIREEMTPIRDDSGDFVGINVNLEIPSNYDKKEILINPNIFDGISQYETIRAGKKYTINLDLNNKSKYSYFYKNKSFKISTKSVVDVNNYLDLGLIGFDGLKIYDLYQPYRTKNEALNKLIDSNDLDLSDEIIDEKLKNLGYSGISDLYRYYLDYYGGKSLYLLASKIFSGEVSKNLETNKQIIILSYNYFYNSLIKFCLTEEECYSIGEFMANKELKNINIAKSNSSGDITKDFYVYIDDNYRNDIYKYYNFFGDFKLVLSRKKGL